MQMLNVNDIEESSKDEGNSNVENNNEGQANEDENKNQSWFVCKFCLLNPIITTWYIILLLFSYNLSGMYYM